MNTTDKITALRDALQFFIDRCDSGMAVSKTTYAKFKEVLALTADASEDAPDEEFTYAMYLAWDGFDNTMTCDERAAIYRAVCRAARPAPVAEEAPFGYIVRATYGDDKHRSIFRQRVFKSPHDQEQCYQQWLEQHKDGLKPFNGLWWAVAKHTVYEGQQAGAVDGEARPPGAD